MVSEDSDPIGPTEGPDAILHSFSIRPEVRTVALVGGGGKTSLMYALAGAIRSQGGSVITTTTTRILVPEAHQSPHLLLLSDAPDLQTLKDRVSQFSHVTVGTSIQPPDKLVDVRPERIGSFIHIADYTIIEADGAKGRPVKAPEDWEPVIPEFTDLVVPVIGMDCLGKPANSRWVFRRERFSAVTGLAEGDAITARALARLLVHPMGALKGVPNHASVIPFLNMKDLPERPEDVSRIVHDLSSFGRGRIAKIVVGRLKADMKLRAYGIQGRSQD